MPIAFSGGPNIYSTFSGASRALIYSGVTAALLSAGWVDTTASAAATGRRYTATSPQGLTLTLDIWDPGSGTQVLFRFAYPTGITHYVGTGSVTYQIVAGPCQLFLSRVGEVSDTGGSVVCGGIPFVPDVAGGADPVCGAVGVNGDPTTSCWWASADGASSPFFTSSNLRQILDVGIGPGGGIQQSEGYYNGSYAGSGPGCSQVITLTFSDGLGASRYPDGSPLFADPLIGWGDTGSGRVKIRGQLWDAVLVLEPHPIDDTTTVFGTQVLDVRFNWMNFVDNNADASLYLATNSLVTGSGNDSYVY